MQTRNSVLKEQKPFCTCSEDANIMQKGAEPKLVRSSQELILAQTHRFSAIPPSTYDTKSVILLHQKLLTSSAFRDIVS